MSRNDDDFDDSDGMTEQQATPVTEPIWMLLEDQQIEEWNLGSEEEPKTVGVNKNLSEQFKVEARKVFEEYKDVFAWEHKDLKGVDPKVYQHRIPLVQDANPVRLQRYQIMPKRSKRKLIIY